MRRYICLFLFIDILLLISNLLQYQIFGIKKKHHSLLSGAVLLYVISIALAVLIT